MKSVLAYDFDDVLVDFNPVLFDYLNFRTNNSFLRGDFPRGKSVFDIFSLSREEVHGYCHDMDSSEFADKLGPVEGSVDCMRNIARRYSCVIITSRPEDSREQVEKLTGRYFPGVFDRIYMGQKEKIHLSEQIGAGVLIDDQLRFLDNPSSIRRILFTRDWNYSSSLSQGIERANDWPHLERLLLDS